MTSISEKSGLRGHSVLVTGATGDIGNAIVAQCLELGASVFCGGRDENKLQALHQQYGDKIIPLCYDITDEKAVKETFRVIQKQQMQPEIGSLVGLVNAAGVMQETPLTVTLMDQLKQQLNVNFLAPYQHMQLASRLMARQRRGSIVNIVSQVGEQGCSGMSAYASSKAALTGATRSLAKELAAIGIRVNAVSPGFIDTALTDHYDAAAKEKVLSRIAMRRAGSAKEVASAVGYLLSAQSSYISGQILAVDGIFSP